MFCTICTAFLHDFLLTGVPEGLSSFNRLKPKLLSKTSWIFAEWICRIYEKLDKVAFKKATEAASRIYKRERTEVEYEYLLSTATFNFLKYELSWLQNEEDYIRILLLELGLLRGKHEYRISDVARDYIRYSTIRAFRLLEEIHEDHIHPKGVMTNLSHLPMKKLVKKEDTDDLYT